MAACKKTATAQTPEAELAQLRAEVIALRERLAKQDAAWALLIKPFIVPSAIYSRDEVAELTGISRRTVERADQEGRLRPIIEQERPKRYLGEELLRWLGYQGNMNIQILESKPAAAGRRQWPPKPEIKAPLKALRAEQQRKEKGSS
jgi:hypothetical protein